MEEIKVKFATENRELIRPRFAGIYFLMQGEQVVFIGEDKDIRHQINKRLEQGLRFDSIGISPFDGKDKKRRALAQRLIQKYQPVHNKIEHKEAASPAWTQQKRRSQPAKKVSLPQSRPGLIQPRLTNGSLQLPVAAPKQTVESIQPQAITPDNNEQRREIRKPVITAEARESLIKWTEKMTQETYWEMAFEKPSVQPLEKSSDLPAWLINLADETLFGDIYIKTEKPGVPTWMKDLDVGKPLGKSVPPFG
ncbi:MAG: hypothetical protein FJ010_05045 [Chloroflexi bacterium]|nr:hypothetical protein [Chloroflexota bacterium]